MTFIPIEQVMHQAERLKVNTLRPCPVCAGTGEQDVPSNMGPGIPKCPVCKGLGYVDLASICACGSSALFFKDGVLYCGRELCLNSQKGRQRSTGFGV